MNMEPNDKRSVASIDATVPVVCKTTFSSVLIKR
jgi:hypothetical protein